MTDNVLQFKTPTQSAVALPDERDHNPRYGDGNGGGGNMEARIAKLESDVGHMRETLKEIKDDVRDIKRDSRTDFRLTFGALIAVALGLAGIMAKGFGWM